ncbi:MAG: TIGR03790 family protein [Oceanipulchritudo sp.]
MPSIMKRRTCIILLLLPWITGLLDGQAPDPDPSSVVVVANRADEGSLRVAKAYLQRRDIPEENLIVLETETGGTIRRPLYVETIHNPILKALLEKGLVEGIEGEPDEYGRKNAAVLDKSVRYLVLCYGLPFTIEEQRLLPEEDLPFQKRHFTGANSGLLKTFAEGPMAKNEASVDSELALLLKRDIPVTGFFPNPLYQNRQPGILQDVLRVTRLDGPSPQAVIRMLDHALEGECKGLKGRAYVDEDGRGGGFQTGNEWMARVAGFLEQSGFDLSHDTARQTFGFDDRFDAPVLYAGWYANKLNGPFTLPGFQFPAGAVAVHLHSFSASNLRSPDHGWVGPFVERGVSATLGNVREPYLTLTHNLDLFFAALLKGWNFGDAAYIALPGLSWQGIAVGDPLFRPFKTSLDEQLQSVGNPLNILKDQYVIGRKINLLVREGQVKEATRLANKGMRETPGPALGLQRARLLMENGHPEKAARALAFFAGLPPSDSGDWGLLAEIADTLDELGEAVPALEIYRNLEKQEMPEKAKLAFLKRGIPVAQDAGEPLLATEWQTRVTPPPPPPKKDSPSP